MSVGKLRNGNNTHISLYLCQKVREVRVLNYNLVSKIPGNFIHGITNIDVKVEIEVEVASIFNFEITTD